MTQWLKSCNAELTLNDMLDDPIVRVLMARDHVARADVEELMANVWSAPSYGDREATFGHCACAPSQECTQHAARH